MLTSLNRFFRDDSGAVTVDWVILTAAIVGFCITAYTLMEDATLDLRDGVATELTVQNDF
ncbi:Flp family type IVb pilin [Sagittula sp. SSi028]|uniref:Flp family type IVb pilin n=1 Tax=Sagittula sp. SSi028 TaxID=3400636 RepID=UPI003AF761D3